MKKILLFMSAVVLLSSCSKEDNNNIERKELSLSNKTTSSIDADDVGAIHGKGLDYFLYNYFSQKQEVKNPFTLYDEMKVTLQDFLLSTNISGDYAYNIKYIFSENLNEKDETSTKISLSKDLNFSFSKNFYLLLDEIEESYSMDFDDFIAFTNKIINSHDFIGLTGIEQNILENGIEVYKDSFIYWTNNVKEWDAVFKKNVSNWTVFKDESETINFNPLYSKKSGWNRFKKYAGDDAIGAIAGGIGGAVGGAIVGSFAGGVGAIPGAIAGGVGGAVSTGISGSVGSYLKDRFWNYPLMEVPQSNYIRLEDIYTGEIKLIKEKYDNIHFTKENIEILKNMQVNFDEKDGIFLTKKE